MVKQSTIPLISAQKFIFSNHGKMEPENNMAEEGKRKKTAIIMAVVFGVFVLYYALMALLAPSGKISEINEKYTFYSQIFV